VGWVANSEQRGTTPDGKDWIADVLCRNSSVKNAIAFEVQWSPQDSEETELRQATYKESGIRGLWLMRQARIPISQQTPAFQLCIENTTEVPHARLPSTSYMEILINWNTAANPGNWSQSIPLDEFVRGALTKRLIFAPALDATVPIRVHAAESSCWKCTKPTTCLIHIELAVDEVFPFHGNHSVTISQIESAVPHG
jgi:competence protein CoiA